MDERDERKRTSGDASKRFQTASELELHYCSRKSVAETYLLATRCPVYRRHDSRSGSRTELENLSGDAKGKGTDAAASARPGATAAATAPWIPAWARFSCASRSCGKAATSRRFSKPARTRRRR